MQHNWFSYKNMLSIQIEAKQAQIARIEQKHLVKFGVHTTQHSLEMIFYSIRAY